MLLQPADLLKTRLQQEHRPGIAPPSNGGKGSTGGGAPQRPLVAVLRTIAAEPRPLRTLWRGTLPSAVRTSLGSALYFGGLDWLRRRAAALGPPLPSGATASGGSRTLPPAANLATGALARAAAGFALMPVTVVKVRAESSGARPLLASTAALWRARGLRGFFAGSAATALRDAPYAGLYVVAYEAIRRRLARVAGVALPEAGRTKAGGAAPRPRRRSTSPPAPSPRPPPPRPRTPSTWSRRACSSPTAPPSRVGGGPAAWRPWPCASSATRAGAGSSTGSRCG